MMAFELQKNCAPGTGCELKPPEAPTLLWLINVMRNSSVPNYWYSKWRHRPKMHNFRHCYLW